MLPSLRLGCRDFWSPLPVVTSAGIEPATCRLEDGRSLHLSYEAWGSPGFHQSRPGPGTGNRTPSFCLEGRHATVTSHPVVPLAGIEPAYDRLKGGCWTIVSYKGWGLRTESNRDLRVTKAASWPLDHGGCVEPDDGSEPPVSRYLSLTPRERIRLVHPAGFEPATTSMSRRHSTAKLRVLPLQRIDVGAPQEESNLFSPGDQLRRICR